MMLSNRKAQFTILALVGVFVVLLIFSLLVGDIQGYITTACSSTDATTCDFTELIPMFIVITILLTVLFFGLPT